MILRAPIARSLFIPLLLAATACQSTQMPETPTTSSAIETPAEPLTVSYTSGQLLSIIFLDDKEGAAAQTARQQYFGTAISLAESYGIRRDAVLDIQAAPAGDFEPDSIVLFSWPDAQSERKFSDHPDFPAAKALRPQAWDALRIATVELETDLTLSFDPAKTYTIATAWSNPSNPTDYDRYMAGIVPGVTAAGGRFVYKMFDPLFETHTAPFDAPNQITLVEWDSPGALGAFQKTEAFKQNAKYLTSGTERFELLVISPSP